VLIDRRLPSRMHQRARVVLLDDRERLGPRARIRSDRDDAGHAGFAGTRNCSGWIVERVEMRVGRIVEALPFPEARKPAYMLRIDFGSLGMRRSSAQLTAHYQPNELLGKLVVAVTNFPPRQIGPVRSEVLVLGVPDAKGEVVLLEPTQDVPLGGRVY